MLISPGFAAVLQDDLDLPQNMFSWFRISLLVTSSSYDRHFIVQAGSIAWQQHWLRINSKQTKANGPTIFHTFHFACVHQNNKTAQKVEIHGQTVRLHLRDYWTQLGDQWEFVQQSRDQQRKAENKTKITDHGSKEMYIRNHTYSNCNAMECLKDTAPSTRTYFYYSKLKGKSGSVCYLHSSFQSPLWENLAESNAINKYLVTAHYRVSIVTWSRPAYKSWNRTWGRIKPRKNLQLVLLNV